jgi:hypothetical protein
MLSSVATGAISAIQSGYTVIRRQKVRSKRSLT